MIINIKSLDNDIIKHIKALFLKKYRDSFSEFIIEGKKAVFDAVLNNAEIKCLIISESFNLDVFKKNILDYLKNSKIYRASDKLFEKISDTSSPQGILAVCSQNILKIEDAKFNNSSFFVFCDKIKDPGNMGTIIRTADAVNASGVILSNECVDIYSPKVVRSTMGSIFHIPIYKTNNEIEAINLLKQNGVKIVAGHLDNSNYLFKENLNIPVCVVIGSESQGVSSDIIKMCDKLIKIPILGKAESLNAGIAAGIILYEVVRQRRNF